MWQFAAWCYDSPVGAAVRDSLWAFPLVETVHLIGLAILGGAVLILNLRLVGILMRSVPARDLAREVRPWLLAGLAIMIASGYVLFSSEAEKMYFNAAFRVKMVCLSCAIVYTFTVHRRALRLDDVRSNRLWRGTIAAISLLLWACVGVSGRAIGFF